MVHNSPAKPPAMCASWATLVPDLFAMRDSYQKNNTPAKAAGMGTTKKSNKVWVGWSTMYDTNTALTAPEAPKLL